MEPVLIVFLVVAGIQLFYYAALFARVGFIHTPSFVSEQLPPASVVICAQNEEENLKRFLKVVLIQQYPQFEVILVNDRSSDNTIDVIVDYYTRNTNVRVVNIPIGEKSAYAGKKDALIKGIELARFETIVVTDADCRPASTQWLAQLVSSYGSGTDIVLGYSPFEKGKGFGQKLIRYENFMTAMQYLGFAKAGMPYMGTGRNMSYKKSLFNASDALTRNKDLPTGDDDLFINSVARGGNTEVCLSKSAFTYTMPPSTFKEWFNQKQRHLRSGFRYRMHHKLLLFVLPLATLLFYILFPVLLVKGIMVNIVCAVFIATLLLKLLLSFRVYSKLEAEDLRFLSPVLDVFFIGYLLIVFFLILLKPKNNWK